MSSGFPVLIMLPLRCAPHACQDNHAEPAAPEHKSTRTIHALQHTCLQCQSSSHSRSHLGTPARSAGRSWAQHPETPKSSEGRRRLKTYVTVNRPGCEFDICRVERDYNGCTAAAWWQSKADCVTTPYGPLPCPRQLRTSTNHTSQAFGSDEHPNCMTAVNGNHGAWRGACPIMAVSPTARGWAARGAKPSATLWKAPLTLEHKPDDQPIRKLGFWLLLCRALSSMPEPHHPRPTRWAACPTVTRGESAPSLPDAGPTLGNPERQIIRGRPMHGKLRGRYPKAQSCKYCTRAATTTVE